MLSLDETSGTANAGLAPDSEVPPPLGTFSRFWEKTTFQHMNYYSLILQCSTEELELPIYHETKLKCLDVDADPSNEASNCSDASNSSAVVDIHASNMIKIKNVTDSSIVGTNACDINSDSTSAELLSKSTVSSDLDTHYQSSQEETFLLDVILEDWLGQKNTRMGVAFVSEAIIFATSLSIYSRLGFMGSIFWVITNVTMFMIGLGCFLPPSNRKNSPLDKTIFAKIENFVMDTLYYVRNAFRKEDDHARSMMTMVLGLVSFFIFLGSFFTFLISLFEWELANSLQLQGTTSGFFILGWILGYLFLATTAYFQ